MALATRGLVAGYGRAALLGPLDLELRPGRFTCLIGANGAGKSTLIRTLCRMQPALAGQVSIDGEPIDRMSGDARARKLAVVLTDRVDASAMSGRELVALGRYPHIGWSARLGPEDHAAVDAALHQVGGSHLAARTVDDMSDGERQKMLIARALAQQPGVLVLDEATAFLDLPRRVATMQLLHDLAREQNLAVLLSSHDLELALRFADVLWLLDAERRLHSGAPEDLALGGTLSSTFAADGLVFDLDRGEVRMGREPQARMRLSGATRHCAWARRALIRAGFYVDPDAPDALHAEPGRYTLTLTGEADRVFETLGELLEWLSALQGSRSSSASLASSASSPLSAQ